MEQRPTKSENVIGFLLAIVGTPVAMYIGASYNMVYISGLPLVLYGIYGLARQRIWYIGGLGMQRGAFQTNKTAIGYSVGFILAGILLPLWFYMALS